ncbi:hypothetical protein G9A89_010350 [Geosiphon pyriformis]|nr:hypothetical protein G9A89_010350 [Geosiphon pyriformis]
MYLNQHPVTYVRARCAVICFNSAVLIDAVMKTTLVLKGINLCWSYLNSTKYAKYRKLDHTFLNCSVDENISPGGPSHKIFVSWANVVGRSLFSPLFVHNNLAASGSSLEVKPILMVSMKLNNRFATLSILAKRLDSPGPMVFQSSPGWVDIIMSKCSGVATGGETIAGVAVFNSLIISKIEDILTNLSIIVMGLLAKIDNASLIMNKFDEVRIFFSSLDKGFFGAGVVIIMNNFLAYYVFKGKILVVILGLYVGASAKTRFGQACEINSLIVKTVNFFTFAVLSENFNENRSRKSVSFKFYLNLGLGAKKIIDYIFVNKSLLSTVAGHKVVSVSDFFDTNHNAVLVLVSLRSFLDTWLNGVCIQTNKDKWKFKIKDVNADKWLHFREHSLVKLLENMNMFNNTKNNRNLDAIWEIFKEMVIGLADSVFSRQWFNIIKVIGLDEFLLVVKELLNKKTAGISGILNELWKHGDTQVLGSLLDVLNCLLSSGLGFVTIYTDGSIKDFGLLGACGDAVTYFLDVNASVRIKVDELLFSILVKLQAIALVLECVPASQSVNLPSLAGHVQLQQ